MGLEPLLNIDLGVVAALAGVLAIGVFLIVQALKVYGVVKDAVWAGRAALIAGFVLGLLAVGVVAFPQYAELIVVGYVIFLGTASAGLFYEYLAKPILTKLFGDGFWSASDLNPGA